MSWNSERNQETLNFSLAQVITNDTLKRNLRNILCEFIEKDDQNSIHYSIAPFDKAHIKVVEFQCSRKEAETLTNVIGAFFDENPPPVKVTGLRMTGGKAILACVESDYLVWLHHEIKEILFENCISVDTSPFNPGIPLFLSNERLSISQGFIGNHNLQ